MMTFKFYNDISKYFTGQCIIENRKAICWIVEGNYHRKDGPAVEFYDGGEEWFIHGKRHRENGPAIINAEGSKHWYFNGRNHRLDGPAIIHDDGSQYWYVGGKHLSKEQFLNHPKVVEYSISSKFKMIMEYENI